MPAEHEAEFNNWYDTEHIPLLAAVPGVLRARRFLAAEGKPRYIALYDLADASVAGSAPWKAALATPWAQRIDTLTRDWRVDRSRPTWPTNPLVRTARGTRHP